MLLLIIFYLAVVNKCYSEAPKTVDFVVAVVVAADVLVVNDVVVALFVITDQNIFRSGQ